MAHSANPRPPQGSAGSSGLATTIAFVTAFRVKRRIYDFKVICLFAFYSDKGAFDVTSNETTEPKIGFTRTNDRQWESTGRFLTGRATARYNYTYVMPIWKVSNSWLELYMLLPKLLRKTFDTVYIERWKRERAGETYGFVRTPGIRDFWNCSSGRLPPGSIWPVVHSEKHKQFFDHST